MIQAKKHDLADILYFLKENLADCIYMYIDIKKYSLFNDNMKVWINRENNPGKIKTVLMKYYDSMQIATTEEQEQTKWLADFLQSNPVSMISGRESLIQKLSLSMAKDYDSIYGMVYRINEYRIFEGTEKIETATLDDCEEIACLICSDEAFQNNYKIKELEHQLRERMETGMGRNVIIRKDGKIVAHIATYAEYENIAVTSGLIVDAHYRKEGYGFVIESYLVNALLREGKEIYTFVIEPKRAALLNAMGAELCSKYGKMTKRN